MLTAIIVITVVFVFFAIVSLIFLGGWHSFRDSNMLGGLLLLWIVVLTFLLIVYFTGLRRG
jgi:NADH:ubiquinone oxidoreductase subunit H